MSLFKKIDAGDIKQGEILFDCKYPVFTEYDLENSSFDIDIYISDFIAMTQACDLISTNGREPVEQVLVARLLRISDFSWTVLSEIRTGRRPAYYLINRDNVHIKESLVVDFGDIHLIPYYEINRIAKQSRNRFKPATPITEQLSHQFGNYFSRIGLDYERTSRELKEEYDEIKGKEEGTA